MRVQRACSEGFPNRPAVIFGQAPAKLDFAKVSTLTRSTRSTRSKVFGQGQVTAAVARACLVTLHLPGTLHRALYRAFALSFLPEGILSGEG